MRPWRHCVAVFSCLAVLVVFGCDKGEPKPPQNENAGDKKTPTVQGVIVSNPKSSAPAKPDTTDFGPLFKASVLLDPPEYVSTAKVFDMLMAVPKFGRVKAARFLNQCRISQSKTVGGLSDRQRAELIGLFSR